MSSVTHTGGKKEYIWRMKIGCEKKRGLEVSGNVLRAWLV
jgi:hypothetical protein